MSLRRPMLFLKEEGHKAVNFVLGVTGNCLSLPAYKRLQRQPNMRQGLTSTQQHPDMMYWLVDLTNEKQ